MRRGHEISELRVKIITKKTGAKNVFEVDIELARRVRPAYKSKPHMACSRELETRGGKEKPNTYKLRKSAGRRWKWTHMEKKFENFLLYILL